MARSAHGLLALVGVADGDTDADVDRLAGRVARLRAFRPADAVTIVLE